MYKFDMHLHSKGDKIRTIKPNEIVKTLYKHNVKIASITDHHKFDKKQFDILSKNKKIFCSFRELNVILK